jgi:SecD/SecF fusion protein
LEPYEHIAKRSVTRGDRQVLEALVVKDEFNVTGADLERAARDFDRQGRPCVAFTLNDVGARRFLALTESNLPDQAEGFRRELGIIIDGKLDSAPVIMSSVYRAAEITGDFTPEQVQDLVDLLNAGSLPIDIRKVEQRVVDIEKQPLP